MSAHLKIASLKTLIQTTVMLFKYPFTLRSVNMSKAETLCSLSQQVLGAGGAAALLQLSLYF